MTLARCAVAAAALVLWLGCGREGMDEPPHDVRGRWTTQDDPAYADRAFEIDDEFIYLLQGGDTFSVHKIINVEVIDDDLPLYVIDYVGDESETYEFRLYLSQQDGGTVFFPNQREMKWHRDPERAVPWDLAR